MMNIKTNSPCSIRTLVVAGVTLSGLAHASLPIDVAVFDFLTPNVVIQSYQATSEASPLEQRPEPLLSPEQIDQLPEYDRLLALQREQRNLERWQEQRRAIAEERYRAGLEASSKVRDVLLTTEYGRGVLRGTPMMEAALSRHRDVFRVFRRRGGEGAQLNLALEQQEMGVTNHSAPTIPTHYIEGRIGDLIKRDMQRVQGSSTITTRNFQLPVTISLHDMATNEQIAIYDELETFVDRAVGRSVMTDAEVMDKLLREAIQKAANQMAEELRPPAPAAPAGDDPVQALRRLRELLDEGLISQEIYDQRSQAILDRL
jgi:hypothetical protein